MVVPVVRPPLIAQDATPTVTTLNSFASAKQAPITPSEPKDVDEGEWAAFEAEMIHGTPAKLGVYSRDAVISAPAMTAEEVAAKSEEEERARRKVLADIELEDEKEDATRALETEFEEMEELEARVRKLKERREALRQRASVSVPASAEGLNKLRASLVSATGKESSTSDVTEGEDEDEEEDDWDGLRFRT
jgi:zinc finger protein 830